MSPTLYCMLGAHVLEAGAGVGVGAGVGAGAGAGVGAGVGVGVIVPNARGVHRSPVSLVSKISEYGI